MSQYYKQSSGGGGLPPEVATQYTEDTGVAVPAANNLNVFGQNSNSAPVMDTQGVGNTISVENRTWETAYVVDSSVTVGTRGTFQTIQAAVTAIIADGVATVSKMGVIIIRSGTYTENISTLSNVRLQLKGSSSGDGPLNVLITGSITTGSAGIISLSNLQVSGSVTDTLIGTGTSTFYADACSIYGPVNLSPSGTFVATDSSVIDLVMNAGFLYGNNSSFGAFTAINISNTQINLFNCDLGDIAHSFVLNGTSNGNINSCFGSISGNATGNFRLEKISISSPIDLPNATVFQNNISVSPGGFAVSPSLFTTFPTRFVASSQGNVQRIRDVTISGSITLDDQYVTCSQAAAITLNLIPTNMTIGTEIIVFDKLGTASTNNITITPSSGTINNAASVVISTNFGANIITWDGTNFSAIPINTNSGTLTSVSGTLNRITSTGGATPIIDIDAGYVGQTSITTLGTVGTGVWNATNIALNKGGTNAALTASNGGVFYSTATAGAILAGTATAGQMLRSGATAAPTWSTATFPATTTANQLLYSSANNTVAGLATANSGVLTTSTAGVPSIDTTNFHVLTTGVQMKGNNTNTAPPAGFIGEQIRSFVGAGSAVNLTNNTAANITSISLTAGIWDVSCVCSYVTGAITGTSIEVSINTVSATRGTQGDNICASPMMPTTNSQATLVIPSYRLTLSATTTVYMVGFSLFSVGTQAAFGRLSATRVG